MDDVGTVPYFQTFGDERIDGTTALDWLEAHLHETVRLAGWEPGALASTPVLLGSTSWLVNERERMLTSPGAAMHRTEDASHLCHVARELQRRTGCRDLFSVATSCTASANAIVQGMKLLRAGLCSRVLVLGFEFFNVLTIEHFHALGLLAEDAAYQPFNGQDGLILGESIACLALEAHAGTPSCPSPPSSPGAHREGDDHPHRAASVSTHAPPQAHAARPNRAVAQLVGMAGGTDSGSLTSTSSTALQHVISDALRDAGIDASALASVKAHGVGTATSDEAEASALQAMKLDALPRFLFKPRVGHTLGASGTTETALLLNALCRRRHAADDTPRADDTAQDEGAHMTGNRVDGNARTPVPRTGARHSDTGGDIGDDSHHLLNFLGFGGSNVALVLRWGAR